MRHFEALAQDPHPSNIIIREQIYLDAWKRRYGTREPRPTLDNLDMDISLGEMVSALKSLKNHKATGVDGIPSEMLKLAASAPNNFYGSALLGVINNIWRG